MSDVTPGLSVPVAGWYPDRGDPTTLRWWDGTQWTEHTHSARPAAEAFAQPVSAEAFGFTPVVQNAVVQNPVAQTPVTHAPGWYVDPANPTMRRWWDGQQWTVHAEPIGSAAPLATAPAAAPYGSGAYPVVAASVNSLATRGMIYSLIALVINPFLILSIGGLVNGIRSLRRVPQFAPENARRGQAITAIVVGAVATVISLILLVTAVVLPLVASHQPRVMNQSSVQQQLLNDLSTRLPQDVASVSCPGTTLVQKGNTFECRVTLTDGETLGVTGTFASDAGDYNYVVHSLDSTDGSTT